VEGVLAQALAVSPQDRPHDAGVFWRALLDAKEQAVAGFDGPASAIPDLVPISRKPSGSHKLDLPHGQPLDFDAGDAEGPSLSLDVKPGELVRRRSLAPPESQRGLPPARRVADPIAQQKFDPRTGRARCPLGARARRAARPAADDGGSDPLVPPAPVARLASSA
jgi:hypothetical protein